MTWMEIIHEDRRMELIRKYWNDLELTMHSCCDHFGGELYDQSIEHTHTHTHTHINNFTTKKKDKNPVVVSTYT